MIKVVELFFDMLRQKMDMDKSVLFWYQYIEENWTEKSTGDVGCGMGEWPLL